MAAIPKLTPDQWAAVRDKWQGDKRDGYAWLIEDMKLPVSAPAVRKVSVRDKWVKVSAKKVSVPAKAQPIAVEAKASAIRERKMIKVSENHNKVSETIKETISETKQENDSNADNESSAGRPTLYREELVEAAYKLALLGMTNEEMASYFEVATSTFSLWMATHSSFSDAVKNGKAIADASVAESLYKSAMGLHVSTEDKLISDGEGGQEVVTLTKQVDPAVSAQIFWLKNRQPKLWKDRVEVKEDINLNVFPPREALDAIYAKALSEAAARDALLANRRERMGITIENGEDD